MLVPLPVVHLVVLKMEQVVSEVAAFFHMGGYAAYVWPSLLISLVVLLANVYLSRIQYKRVLLQTARRAKARADSKTTEAKNTEH